jgi:O-antigen/teichoic acid export membrane protein
LTGLLSALAIRADFLVLSSELNTTDLGFYYFGFMLVMSLTALISSGINRTLLPIFAKHITSTSAFQKQFFSVATGIATVSSCMSLLIIIFGPYLMHHVWDGKWDGSAVVVIMAAVFIPIRMMNVIAHTTLEAKGEWLASMFLSLIEIIVLVVFVYIGVALGGLFGACIGTALQRIISSFVSFPFVCLRMNISVADIIFFFIRAFVPFLLSIFVYVYGEQFYSVAGNFEPTGFEVGSFAVTSCFSWLLLTLMFNHSLSVKLLRWLSGLLK